MIYIISQKEKAMGNYSGAEDFLFLSLFLS